MIDIKIFTNGGQGMGVIFFLHILLYYFICVIIKALDISSFIVTWILGVVSKQLRLLHGHVEDSTTSLNSLSP